MCGHRGARGTKTRTSRGFLEHSWKKQSSTHLWSALVYSLTCSPPEVVSARPSRDSHIFHLWFPALVWFLLPLRPSVKCMPEMDLPTVFKEGMPQTRTLHNLAQGCITSSITACFKSMQCKVTMCRLHRSWPPEQFCWLWWDCSWSMLT